MTPQEDLQKAKGVVNGLLAQVAKVGATELFLTTEYPPAGRIDNKIVQLMKEPLAADSCRKMAQSICDERRWQVFLARSSVSFIFTSPSGRFRASLFMQQRRVGMVIRHLPGVMPTIDEAGLSEVIKPIVLADKGLIVIASPSGNGRTTTLAAALDHRNRFSQGHIVAIEEMIEFPQPHKQCIVTQREIGSDTPHMRAALSDAFHQAANAIFVSDVIDSDSLSLTMRHVEAGRLVVISVVAEDSVDAIRKLVELYPANKREEASLALSTTLAAVCAQQIATRQDGGALLVTEMLVGTHRVLRDVARGDLSGLKGCMESDQKFGMHTFNQRLFDFYESGVIDLNCALFFSDDRISLRFRLRTESSRYDAEGGEGGGEQESLMPKSDAILSV
ncbi:ATPase, T2SS/T4P/T4SS family [Devosia sp.]|uniref:ATPase, T2SS/T4P/T4SS family n=1 Tax=Devosia sp. TaxID=1871048 RepID=UPI0027355687|nr:ATPase, T2SS/T4P/T4SS family [Devosia sp.]MDP2782264.1 ATPase, T2SS/T4P/T4SS family [Devosia sp.]